MRAVLVGNDYLKDNNGNFKHLESNTSVLPSFARSEDYFNKSVFDQFLFLGHQAYESFLLQY